MGAASGYLERKIGNLTFSIPAGAAFVDLNQAVPFLRTSAYWNGLVPRLIPWTRQDSTIAIRPKVGSNYTRKSLRFYPNQADVAFNITMGNEVTFRVCGLLLDLDPDQRASKSWLSEETVNGRIQRVQFVPAVREKSFSVEARRELEVETRFGLLTLADLKGISHGMNEEDEISCRCFLTATFEKGNFISQQNLVAQVYSVIQGALVENRPEKFSRFFLKECSYRVVEHSMLKNKRAQTFYQASGDCVYAKILRRNNHALIRDRASALVWKTSIGSFVLAFDLTSDGISAVYVDAAENYSVKEEVLFFRWVNCAGSLLP